MEEKQIEQECDCIVRWYTVIPFLVGVITLMAFLMILYVVQR